MGKKVFDRDVEAISLKLLERIATPRALTVAILLRYKVYDQIAELRVDPSHYNDSESYFKDAQATELLRKYTGLPLEVDLAEKAEETFLECEKQCYLTNQRLSKFIDFSGRYYCPADEREIGERFFNPLRKLIAKVLGPLPQNILCKHGPGLTFGDKGRLGSTLAYKLSSEPTTTDGAACLLDLLYWPTLWGRNLREKSPRRVPGNRFTSVPKDSTKNRGICIEPSFNVFAQLGVGGYIRQRLKKVLGIDLETGQLLHRRLACTASRDSSLATIDLSNASDTVARSLVKILLPPQWYLLLETLRSPMTLFGDQWHRLEKFSSMGNGFTFELETLIFYCIAAQFSDEVYAYGDDLIVENSAYTEVISALNYCGFTPNKRKSFHTGYFRESCGGDFFNGVEVRPHYIKEIPNAPEEFMSLANGLRRASGTTAGIWLRPYLRPAWIHTVQQIPAGIRVYGPASLGDLVIHDECERWRWRTSNSIREIRVWKPCAYHFIRWRRFPSEARLLVGLYTQFSTDDRGVLPRDSVRGYKLGWVNLP